MRHHMQHQCKFQTEGQALIFVALMMVVLVAMVGLGIDGSNILLQRRTAANVADAAALAGTRAFVEAKKRSASDAAVNAAVYNAASSYVSTHLGSTGVTFRVSYYLNNGDPSNRYYQLSGASDITSLPSRKTHQELTVRGIQVEVGHTFNNSFMQVVQINTSAVEAKGLGYFGYLGSVVGQDVIPLGLDMSAGNILRDGGEFRIHVFDDHPEDPLSPVSYDIYSLQVGLLDFVADPNVANTPGCGVNPRVMSYWWCAGSASTINIGDKMTIDSFPFTSSLRSYVRDRIDSGRNIVLLPEYFPGDSTISSFVAVELVRIDNDALIVRYVPYFYTSGSISGNGSGVPGAYAVNLVR